MHIYCDVEISWLGRLSCIKIKLCSLYCFIE